MITTCFTRLPAQVKLPYNWRPIRPEFRNPDSKLVPDTLPNKKKLLTISSLGIGGYGIAYGVIGFGWYAGVPSTKFHFFNDMNEWQQIDKVGHIMGTYQGSRGMIALLKWSGLPKWKTAMYGALSGFVYMTSLEVFDGFATKWGFSPQDMMANFAGSSLAFGNEMLWSEQRLQVKVSYHPTYYAKRFPNLFGGDWTSFLKDYNGHTGWLSARVWSFLPEGNFRDKYPKWLNLAFGYGANGLQGGYHLPPDPERDRREYRQYYLALDIDLSMIPTRVGWLKVLLGALNCVHLPMPTLEWNQPHGFRLHGLYM